MVKYCNKMLHMDSPEQEFHHLPSMVSWAKGIPCAKTKPPTATCMHIYIYIFLSSPREARGPEGPPRAR